MHLRNDASASFQHLRHPHAAVRFVVRRERLDCALKVGDAAGPVVGIRLPNSLVVSLPGFIRDTQLVNGNGASVLSDIALQQVGGRGRGMRSRVENREVALPVGICQAAPVVGLGACGANGEKARKQRRYQRR
jgi:hypothetical protein